MSQELKPFDELKAGVTHLVAPALDIRVTDAKSGESALDAVRQIKDLSNQVQKKRKELVGPLNARVDAINDYAKDILAPLLEAETHIKNQLRDFELEQQKIRAEERMKAEAERIRLEAELRAKQEAEREAAEAALAENASAASIFGSAETEEDLEQKHAALEEKQLQEQAILRSQVKAREQEIADQGVKTSAKVWKVELVDMDKVPAQYVIREINEKALLALARAGVTDIPGVRFYQDVSIRIGRNTRMARAAIGETG